MNSAVQEIQDACTHFRDIASRVAHWMARQPSVGEESVTDWLLFETSERLPWVRYRKFTRHEESRKSGADWDWWLVSRRASLGLRVQAKKVVAGTDHYRGLAHTSRTGLQIELLLEAARQENLLAFYALYCSPRVDPAVKCGGRQGAGTDEGVFLADAGSLYASFLKAGRTRVEADALLAHSNPLSCLFCCPLVLQHGPDPVEGVHHQITQYFGEGIREAGNSNVDSPGLSRRPPAHIASLLEAEAVPDWWEREFASSLRNTNAVLVFDLRRG